MKKKKLETEKDISEEEYERHFKNALSNFGGISEEEIDEGLCFNCKHFIKDDICEAFPDGIPLEVVAESFIHDKVHPEQENDILFERVKSPRLVEDTPKTRKNLDYEPEHRKIIEHSLTQRGLKLNYTVWEIYGPNKNMNYQVYVGEVFQAPTKRGGKRKYYTVAIYPWGVYEISFHTRWWETKKENRFCIVEKNR